MQRPVPTSSAPPTGRRKKHRRGGGALGPTGANPARQTPAPERQCVVCRRRQPQPALLQLAQPVAGETTYAVCARPAGGKAAYVCVRRPCLQALAERSADAAAWLQRLEVLATQRFTAMLGLARRQGALLLGASRMLDPKTDAQGLTIYVADDAAQRTRHRLGEGAAPCMLSAEALGRAVGGRDVAAVGIPPGQLSQRAAYWRQVWYEARRLDVNPATQGSTPNRRRIEVAR